MKTVTFKNAQLSHESILANRKENGGFYKEIAIIGTKGGRVIARFYMPGKTKIYCCVWINNGFDFDISAGGNSSGNGFCKLSAAFSNACDNAGIVLPFDVSGAGESEVCRAMEAIATAAGISKANQIFHTANA